MQELPFKGLLAYFQRPAVSLVSQHGVAYEREMASYLVSPSGYRVRRYHRISAVSA